MLLKNNNLKIHNIVYFSFMIISVIWITLIFAAPYFYSQGGDLAEIGTYIYLFFSKCCHQIDSRSFKIFGYKLAVCSRCTAIYLGFFLSVILYPFIRKIRNREMPNIWILIFPVLLLAADTLLDLFEIYKNGFVSRSITGLLIGFVLPLFLIPGFINFVFGSVKIFVNNNKT